MLGDLGLPLKVSAYGRQRLELELRKRLVTLAQIEFGQTEAIRVAIGKQH
jgi:hypothetical protein